MPVIVKIEGAEKEKRKISPLVKLESTSHFKSANSDYHTTSACDKAESGDDNSTIVQPPLSHKLKSSKSLKSADLKEFEMSLSTPTSRQVAFRPKQPLKSSNKSLADQDSSRTPDPFSDSITVVTQPTPIRMVLPSFTPINSLSSISSHGSKRKGNLPASASKFKADTPKRRHTFKFKKSEHVSDDNEDDDDDDEHIFKQFQDPNRSDLLVDDEDDDRTVMHT
jgi:hypothetical protein